jgi:hypothetical protein
LSLAELCPEINDDLQKLRDADALEGSSRGMDSTGLLRLAEEASPRRPASYL